MESISVPEASDRLGVNERRVRQLIELGRLPAQKIGKQWVIDPRNVDALTRADRQAGRPYSSSNAWALLIMAAGRQADWLSIPDRTRLRNILESHGIAELRPRLSRRSELREWYVHPSLLDQVRADPRVVVSGAGAVDSLIDESLVEVYIASAAEQRIEADYFAESGADRPNAIARVIDGPWPFEPGQTVADSVVAAVDLLDRPSDARTVRVAEQELANA